MYACFLFIFPVSLTGELITVALRPSIMYGEEDHRFFPAVAKVAHKFGDVIPKVLGAGGKHQQAYAGKVSIN